MFYIILQKFRLKLSLNSFKIYDRGNGKRGELQEDVKMISQQVIQTSIDELKAIKKVDLCVMYTDGLTVATLNLIIFMEIEINIIYLLKIGYLNVI